MTDVDHIHGPAVEPHGFTQSHPGYLLDDANGRVETGQYGEMYEVNGIGIRSEPLQGRGSQQGRKWAAFVGEDQHQQTKYKHLESYDGFVEVAHHGQGNRRTETN